MDIHGLIYLWISRIPFVTKWHATQIEIIPTSPLSISVFVVRIFANLQVRSFFLGMLSKQKGTTNTDKTTRCVIRSSRGRGLGLWGVKGEGEERRRRWLTGWLDWIITSNDLLNLSIVLIIYCDHLLRLYAVISCWTFRLRSTVQIIC